MKLATNIFLSTVLVLLLLLMLLLIPPAGWSAGTEDEYDIFKFSISEDNMIQVWCPPYVCEVGIVAFKDADMSGEEGTYYYRYYYVGNHSYARTIKMDVPLDHYYLIDFVHYDAQREIFIKYNLEEPTPVIFSLEDVKWYGSANMSWHEVNLDWPKNSVSWIVDIDGYDGQGSTYRRHLEFPVGEESSRHEIITDLPAEGKVTVSLYAKRGGMVSEKTKKTICIPMKPLSGLTGTYISSNPPTIELKWQPSANRRQDAIEIERTNPARPRL